MNFQLLTAYSSQLSLIVTLALQNKAANADETTARDNRKGGLVDSIKAFSRVTHADGVPVADASDVLRMALQASTDEESKPIIPAGTVKNYCAAARGFRKLLAAEVDITDKSTKDATDAIRSTEQASIDASKAEFRKLTKKYTAAQWSELVELVTPSAPAVKEEAADEGEEEQPEATPAVAEAA